MHSRIESIDVFLFDRPRDEAYLGNLGAGEVSLGNGHILRKFNGTVYPTSDRSVVVRMRDSQGAEGWGETYGLVAPKMVAALISDLFGPYLRQIDPTRPDSTWDALYALQRVRGYWGGYLGDTLCALDIALWDLHSRAAGQSLQAALGRPGGGRLPGYVSGLPGDSREARLDLARAWQARGFDSFKFPVSHTDDGDVAGEFRSLRSGLGEAARIGVDMHWKYSVDETVALDAAVEEFSPWFLEAPVMPEDISAQREVARRIRASLALGEEWRTEWDYIPRGGDLGIVQPEMGHTGVTQFGRIAARAKADGAAVIPHATIGLGIFMSASLRAGLAFGATAHEFQHTIYHRNAALLEGAATCESGVFDIPDTAGHGVVPTADAFEYLTPLLV